MSIISELSLHNTDKQCLQISHCITIENMVLKTLILIFSGNHLVCHLSIQRVMKNAYKKKFKKHQVHWRTQSNFLPLICL